MSIKGEIRRWLEPRLRRRGYHLLSEWRLAKYDQTTHTSELLDALAVDCVLDVGANIGQYYRFLRRYVGYDGTVVSLEPVEEMYRALVGAAPQDPKWHVHRLALGEQNTTMTINVARERTLSSFLPRNEAGLQAMGYQKYLRETELSTTEAVEMRRLDDVLPEIVPHRPARIFLKSDTQGYDMNVIRGARQCLDSIVALQVELSVRHVYSGSTSYLDALAEMEALGYELTGVFPVQRDSALRVVNLDCVLVRHQEAERLRARRAAAGGN
jgi:FkbM family methyltransferase